MIGLIPLRHEEAIELPGGETLRLRLDFAALDVIEGIVGEPFDVILNKIGGEAAPRALQGKVLWGLLRAHHPEVSLDAVKDLVFGPLSILAGAALGRLIDAAFHRDTPGKPETDTNPPVPPGASEPS